MAWVGGAREQGAKEGDWVWQDLTTMVNFTNWEDEEEEDEQEEGEMDMGGTCLALKGEKGSWVERPCSHRLSYICQIRLDSVSTY